MGVFSSTSNVSLYQMWSLKVSSMVTVVGFQEKCKLTNDKVFEES